MAVKLRLRRLGKKKQPIYKIVAADSRSPRDGRFIEAIGLYNPRTEPATLELKEERAFYWLKCGAIPTDTVRSLLSRKGLMLKLDLTKKNYPEEKIQEELEKFKALQEEKLAKNLEKKGIQRKPKEKKLETPEAIGATSEENKGESA